MPMNEPSTNALGKADCDSLRNHFLIENREKYFWGFTCFSRQDYVSIAALDCVDEIMLGIQCTEGGCLCELAFRWYWLNRSAVPGWNCSETPGPSSKRRPLWRLWMR